MKAIFVIDMPKTCDDCRLHLESSGGQYRRFCVAKNEISVGKKKPKWCPLKPLPQKQNKDKEKSSLEYIYEAETLDEFQIRGASYLYGCIDGWNNCLKEIEGD